MPRFSPTSETYTLLRTSELSSGSKSSAIILVSNAADDSWARGLLCGRQLARGELHLGQLFCLHLLSLLLLLSRQLCIVLRLPCSPFLHHGGVFLFRMYLMCHCFLFCASCRLGLTALAGSLSNR